MPVSYLETSVLCYALRFLVVPRLAQFQQTLILLMRLLLRLGEEILGPVGEGELQGGVTNLARNEPAALWERCRFSVGEKRRVNQGV